MFASKLPFFIRVLQKFFCSWCRRPFPLFCRNVLPPCISFTRLLGRYPSVLPEKKVFHKNAVYNP
ncbi:hypothetical protein HMPREF9436_01299 [Faecalibacterium cf. prausnitzii KLE1255]|uniref:Uncharacterized protein n=1 Tax=Faecalibacterium cf. prausnitzii KLE1255 TaxID=748224 RepID=E2ZI09_9FIRM|nr:hypothetical protein HMPREF9436_01299 [Faecalibacterium cf. prausnitzii KLE1255]